MGDNAAGKWYLLQLDFVASWETFYSGQLFLTRSHCKKEGFAAEQDNFSQLLFQRIFTHSCHFSACSTEREISGNVRLSHCSDAAQIKETSDNSHYLTETPC